MMMATEMAIMAIFMVMYMMDPGGLGEMDMTHQKRASQIAGALSSLVALAIAFLTSWGPIAAEVHPAEQVYRLGLEIMERSMLIFETAGVTILTAMIAATAIAIKRRGSE
jgi:NADH:ubiquinone oxidoreductase subunit 6 (subunit J)